MTEPVVGGHRYRMTVRARLALTYSALLTGAGIVLLSIIYAFMRFVPTYDLVPAASVPAATLDPVAPSPLPSPSEGSSPAASTVPAELLINSTDQMLNVLLGVSVIVLLVLAVAGIAVGWAVAGRMLRPLQYINGAARKAANGDLQQRIHLTGPRDEISELATNFDEMLAQLERSFAASKRFALNASHELRTPLATSRAMLDVAIAQDHDEEARAVFDRLRIMNERSIETVEALLDLAKIQSSTARPELIDLAAAASEVVSACRAEAVAHGVRVEAQLDAATVEVEPVLLRQLLTNLVQNAVRHNIDDGVVTVRTGTDAAGAAEFEISNSGVVLDEGMLAGLSEPFARAAGRTAGSSTRGHGLGLSIVSAIVDRFRGTLELEPRPDGGLRAIVRIPAAAATSS
ncbi:two-component system sensor histidine kinase VanS [Microterricola gilva]|uniref:histidine kinase n=1 Tax=Microterricola gilva TaxID=393267 RepID=A0A4Q8AQ39_9MICO|nr:HAMP domain-containing sensor histidine kinase [Microterricola gilva]RZU66119.1 two-component system sensor histidine kinase VanS [Microterricola gilva]